VTDFVVRVGKWSFTSLCFPTYLAIRYN
jgi:hypothetical protein